MQFNLDFMRKFPHKSKMLYAKYPEFKQKMQTYYANNIKEVMCKGLLAMSKSHAGKGM